MTYVLPDPTVYLAKELLLEKAIPVYGCKSSLCFLHVAHTQIDSLCDPGKDLGFQITSGWRCCPGICGIIDFQLPYGGWKAASLYILNRSIMLNFVQLCTKWILNRMALIKHAQMILDGHFSLESLGTMPGLSLLTNATRDPKYSLDELSHKGT